MNAIVIINSKMEFVHSRHRQLSRISLIVSSLARIIVFLVIPTLLLTQLQVNVSPSHPPPSQIALRLTQLIQLSVSPAMTKCIGIN